MIDFNVLRLQFLHEFVVFLVYKVESSVQFSPSGFRFFEPDGIVPEGDVQSLYFLAKEYELVFVLHDLPLEVIVAVSSPPQVVHLAQGGLQLLLQICDFDVLGVVVLFEPFDFVLQPLDFAFALDAKGE